ncbi:MAG: hypothetical protein HQK83_02135 [Fibrobacteria bacterium]|nr:hypothetical protein [Fibrobacteria bacterium]
MLPTYFPILKKMFVEDNSGSIPLLIRKSIAAALSTKCSSTYCFIGHSMYLINNGISQEELSIILQQFQFPSRIPDHSKWSQVLKWAYIFGNSSLTNPFQTKDIDMAISNTLSEDERQELFNLIMGNMILNRFSEYYTEDISWQYDIPKGKKGEQFKALALDLVSFYHKVSDKHTKTRPVITMCMHCKDVRDSSGIWHAFETSLSTIEKDSMFSHSICPTCHEKYHTVCV